MHKYYFSFGRLDTQISYFICLGSSWSGIAAPVLFRSKTVAVLAPSVYSNKLTAILNTARNGQIAKMFFAKI